MNKEDAVKPSKNTSNTKQSHTTNIIGQTYKYVNQEKKEEQTRIIKQIERSKETENTRTTISCLTKIGHGSIPSEKY